MDNKGIALIITLITLLYFVIMGTAFLVILNSAYRVSSVQGRSMKAFWLAEAGIEKTIVPILMDTGWTENSDSSFIEDLGEGNFEIGIDYIGTNEQVEITSKGMVKSIDRTIKAEIINIVEESVAFESVIFTAKNLTYNGNPVVNGDIVVKGTISGSKIIEGENTQTEHSPEPFPTLDENYFSTLAKENKANGNSGVNGNYFQGGKPSFSSLNGVIFIDKNPDGSPADVKLKGNLSTTDGNPATLIVIGSLTIVGNVAFNGLIYTTGPASCETELGGSIHITGGIISKNNIDLHGAKGLTINHDVDLVITETNISGFMVAKLYSWQEIYQ